MTLLPPCLQIYKNFFEWKKKKQKTGHDSIQKNANAGQRANPLRQLIPKTQKNVASVNGVNKGIWDNSSLNLLSFKHKVYVALT